MGGVGNHAPGVIRLIYEPNPTLEVRGKRLSPKAKNLDSNREKKRTNEIKRPEKYKSCNNNNTDSVPVNQSNRTIAKPRQQKLSQSKSLRIT